MSIIFKERCSVNQIDGLSRRIYLETGEFSEEIIDQIVISGFESASSYAKQKQSDNNGYIKIVSFVQFSSDNRPS